MPESMIEQLLEPKNSFPRRAALWRDPPTPPDKPTMNTALLAGTAPGNAPGIPPVAVAPSSLRWETQRAGGVVVVRHRTAVDVQPADDWPDQLAAFLGQGGRVAMAGAKRLDPAGNVHAMGEFVVHPKGFHHHGRGVLGQAYRFPEEVDTLAAGVAVLNEEVFDEVNGDELLSWGEIGLLSLGLAVRQAGLRVLAVPQVVVTDPFSPEPTDDNREKFRGRFGFDWWAADLDEVREHHFEDGLSWNARFLAAAMPFEKYEERGALVWESYQKADYFRQRAHHLASAAKQCCPDGGLLLDIGCGDGFFSHLFAQQGLEVLGLDPEPEGVEQSRRMTENQQYPGPRPRFEVGRGDAIPREDASVAAVTLFDVIEHLQNPLVILREIARVLRPGGKALIVTPGWQFGASSDAVYHGFEYTMEELARQIAAVPGLSIAHTGQITGVYRDLVVVAEKTAG
ncbi:MAG: class I SAM-dependent methyltransferase [Planctomycetota bacterium]